MMHGFLGIWADIREDMASEWYRWHSEDHMAERVAIPGFLAGRRYDLVDERLAARAPDSRRIQHCYMMYEGAALTTFNSDPYLERLNNPTPWTRAMAPAFQNFARGACELASTSGDGYGGFLLLMRFDEGGREADLSAASIDALDHFVETLPGLQGVTAAHFGFCRPEITDVDTAEKKTRTATSEQQFGSALLIEGYDLAFLIKHFPAIEANLKAIGLPADRARYGFYALSNLLTERTTEEANKRHD